MSIVSGTASAWTDAGHQDDLGSQVPGRVGRGHTSAKVADGLPVSASSSNWFGVMILAAGTTRSRISSGMPGRT